MKKGIIISGGLVMMQSFMLAAQEKPNVVLVLADDFGYGSLNCYGAPDSLIRTPNINRLSENGVTFVNASTPASVSSPTRYGLLTGSYPWRSSLKYGVVSTGSPMLISPETSTIADIFKNEGYRTAAIGKWHLGYTDHKHDFTEMLSPGPLDLGFDYHFGIPQNNDDYTGVFIENDHVYGLRSDRKVPYSRSYYGKPYLGLDAPQRDNKTVMQTLTDKAVDWVRSVGKDEPFFLYFAATAVHHPITPSDYMRGMSDAGPYGDFIQDLDYCVGQIMATLEYMGELDNTIIIFTSDNGGDIPKIDTPEKYAMDHGLKINGDLKGDKHTIWQGGTNVPLVVYWKGKVMPDTVSEDMVNLVDFYATFTDMFGHSMPDDSSVAPDSFSFLASILGSKGGSDRESMVTADANGIQAIRCGDWKYIDDYIPESLPEKKLKALSGKVVPQLYNLKEDPAETKNVIDSHKDIAGKLRKMLQDTRTRPSRNK